MTDVDGYVVCNLGIWTGASHVFTHSGKPVVLVDDLYAGSGETLICASVATREKLPVVTVSSSDFADVIAAVRLFETIRAMKEATILDIVDYDTGLTTRNVDEPKACRTKLAAQTNPHTILNNRGMGWHRVTVYGDWRRQVMDLARLLGFTVTKEGKA